MRHFHKRSSWILLGCLLFGMVPAPDLSADTKTLIQQAKAALRAAENASDEKVKGAKLSEARRLIDQIIAADPKNSEIGTLESKYKFNNTGLEATKAAAPAPAADSGRIKEVLADWNEIVKLDKDLYAKTNRFFPQNIGMAYSKEQTDQVLAVIDGVAKDDRPRILAYLKEFSRKYGEPNDEMDRKIYALTPKDPKKGMYDEENIRPSDLPSRCYKDLEERLNWIQESPKAEAKRIMKDAMELVADADFYMDAKRDAVFAEAEAELDRAKRFNPKDAEISQALASLQAGRKKSKADVQKALEAARFPANTASFAGPGKIPDLAAAVKTYFSRAYPKEKLLAVSIAGAWTATKRNILDQPVQWGLPVFCASQQGEAGICRVFKMTVLTGIGADIPKAPPFTDHWTGDSYRMLIANLK
jgi:hypothetical protein